MTNVFIEVCRELCVSHSHNLHNHRKNHSDANICFEDLFRICTKTFKSPLCWIRIWSFKESMLYYCKQQVKPERKQGDRSNVREEGGDCRGRTHDSVLRKCINSGLLHTLLNPSGHNAFTAVERTPSSKGWSVRLLRYYSVVSLFHV